MTTEILDKNIQMYNMCPGYCRTDMTSPNAPRSVEEGCETALWLIQKPSKVDLTEQGCLFKEYKIAGAW